jgi:hypothetical protein
MAFLLEPAAELVLSGLEAGEATNIVQGAETIATQFKNEIIKSIPFGIGEGVAFTGAQQLYNNLEEQNKANAKKSNPIKQGRIKKRTRL